jgi:ATP-dependent Lon protease
LTAHGIVLLDRLALSLAISCDLQRGRGNVTIQGPITSEIEDVYRRSINACCILADYGEYDLPDLEGTDILLRFAVNGGDDIPVGGESYGLALASVLASSFARRTISPSLAFVGGIAEDGTVQRIEGIDPKRRQARGLGYGQLMLPAGQLDFFSQDIDQIPVATIFEAWSVLRYERK